MDDILLKQKLCEHYLNVLRIVNPGISKTTGMYFVYIPKLQMNIICYRPMFLHYYDFLFHLLGKILYEYLEIEVYKAANDFNHGRSSIPQFRKSIDDISEKCNIVLNCLSTINDPTPFERLIINSTKQLKLGTTEVYKNLTALKS